MEAGPGTTTLGVIVAAIAWAIVRGVLARLKEHREEKKQTTVAADSVRKRKRILERVQERRAKRNIQF